MNDDVTTITFRLPASLREKIKEQAKLEERSEGGFIRFHISQLLAVADEEIDEESKAEVAEV